MSKLITKFFNLIEKLCKENPSVFLFFFLLSFLFNVLLCWLLYKCFRKLESERKKFNDEKIDKVRAEERLTISIVRVAEFKKLLQESESREAKLQNKLDIIDEKKSYLSEKNVELEVENRWQKQKIEELEKENEKLKRQVKKE